MTGRPRVALLVLHASRRAPLAACLESIAAQSYRDFELFVGDNASGDPLLETLGAEVTVVRFPRNLGFAAGNDALWAQARRESGASFVALVNDDVVLAPDWLALLVAALDVEPQAAAAQGSLARPDGRLEGNGLEWTPRLECVPLGHGSELPARDLPVARRWGVTATAAVYRAASLDAVGLDGGSGAPAGIFEPALFAYYEDVELALRLHRAGWHALHVPGARAVHAGSATGSLRPARLHMRLASNRWLVLARHLRPGAFAAALPAILRADLAHAATLARRADWRGLAGLAAAPWRTLALAPRVLSRRVAGAATPRLARLPGPPGTE